MREKRSALVERTGTAWASERAGVGSARCPEPEVPHAPSAVLHLQAIFWLRTLGAAPIVLSLYALTLFLSAFLLFGVQPMFTKMVLPLLGGSAAVWNTAMAFFQTALLLGYLYAHVSTRYLHPKRQTLVHAGVLALGCVALPIGVARGWEPPSGGAEIPWLVGLLSVSIGLPFFALSATAPLLQRWFAHTEHASARDPYFLYSGSNLGSLLALLSYPFVVEPVLGLRAQSAAWTAGYALLAAAIGGCALLLWRRYQDAAAPIEADGAGDANLVAQVGWGLRARWLALSAVPSALLIGATLHIGSDIAAVPLLWVLPLALYLLTFVLVFARRQLFRPGWMRAGQVVFVGLVAALYQPELPHPLLVVPLHLGALFFSAMVCHGELARLRPVTRHLTEFYLVLSLGGVVGGVLASIVAPLVFDSVLEYPLALLLALLLRPQPAEGSRLAARLGVRVPRALRWGLDLALPALLWVLLAVQVRGVSWWSLVEDAAASLRAGVPALAGPLGAIGPSAFWLTVAAAFACLAPRPLRLALGFLVVLSHSASDFFVRPDELLVRERSFFGVYRVHELDVEGVGRVRVLRHGTTNHGTQNVDRPIGGMVYYTREGPVGQFFRAIEGTPAESGRMGVIGLGIGAMACYAAPGQRLTYYEIDALDERIARDPQYFTYLQHCGKNVDVVIGDGRLKVAEEPDGAFEVLVVDAFSGDAIPAHLLTREALALYLAKLSPTGLLLLHVTNTYLDLLPVVSELVADAGLHARYSAGFLPPAPLATPSDWVVVARRENQLARFAFTSPPWKPLPPGTGARPWTDDYTNLLSALRFERYQLATQ